jgi:hypothetical protein
VLRRRAPARPGSPDRGLFTRERTHVGARDGLAGLVARTTDLAGRARRARGILGGGQRVRARRVRAIVGGGRRVRAR